MRPFVSLTGVAAPLLIDNVNTDLIVPARLVRLLNPDYKGELFGHWRRDGDGNVRPDFILNQGPFRSAQMLVGGANFGCGSSREAAAWGMLGFGIRCVVARSVADFFRENCLKNGILTVVLAAADQAAFEETVLTVNGAAPFTADLPSQEIRCPDGTVFRFEIGPGEKAMLLGGLDDIGITLQQADEVTAWENATARSRPWLQRIPARTA